MIVLCGCAFAGCDDKETTQAGAGSGSGAGAAKGTVRITFVEVK
jgi:uncharacterized spore protein YtfJ